ncbi:MAG TPA: glycosyltransferase [Chitinophagaceae bacterium]|jgi:UDP:flavonoid glycosyltransferase YjiC (YdhE family)|nr:glycosyltransferase [Chitinophagaceae bacterium]
MKPLQDSVKPRILVAPLDWGLGHATRCVPLVRALLESGCEVILAGEEKTAALLSAEFPELTILPLKGYRINYAKNRRWLAPQLLLQVPRLQRVIREENNWLRQIVAQHRIHAVLSDNRYGLWHPQVPCVLLTHQLCIRTGWGKLADRLLQRLHYRYIRRFTECWVPDEPEAPGLAGRLSHTRTPPPLPVYYTGPLSRLQRAPAGSAPSRLLVLLSGPEPQRTLLEEILWSQLTAAGIPALLVRGLPGAGGPALPRHPALEVVNHLPAAELEAALNAAPFVVARSGYSTVMDLMALGKRSLLIPTPGQTEQEYLARLLSEQHRACCVAQHRLDLPADLKTAETFPYRFPEAGKNPWLPQVLSRFLAGLKAVS